MTYSLSKELNTARQVLRRASEICQSIYEEFQGRPPIHRKGDDSPVTVADLASQALILQTLKEAFPEDGVVAEEDTHWLAGGDPGLIESLVEALEKSGEEMALPSLKKAISWRGKGREAPRYWVLDPLDGTKGYLAGKQYAIALALVEDHQVSLGLLACPRWKDSLKGGSLFWACRRGGAWRESLEIAADSPPVPQGLSVNWPTLTEARLCQSRVTKHKDQQVAEDVEKHLGLSRPALLLDSQVKYAAVASGEAQIYLRKSPDTEYREKVWDHAAGYLLVEEAGGKVTDLRGDQLDFSTGEKLVNNRGILATDGSHHSKTLAFLKKKS